MECKKSEENLKTLKCLATENILENSYLNYKLCQKYYWKLSSKIGVYLFHYLCEMIRSKRESKNIFHDNSADGYFRSINKNSEDKSRLREEDLLIFQKTITDLSILILDFKNLDYMDNFNFLNGHNLDNLSIANLKRFSLCNTEFSLTSNHLSIYPTECFRDTTECLKVFFSNLLVKNSLSIYDESSCFLYTNLSYLLENSREFLKSISFHSCFFPLSSLLSLQGSIKKMKFLEKIRIEATVFHISVYGAFCNFIKNIFWSSIKSLQELKIILLNQQRLIDSLFETLDEIKNLKDFSITHSKEVYKNTGTKWKDWNSDLREYSHTKHTITIIKK